MVPGLVPEHAGLERSVKTYSNLYDILLSGLVPGLVPEHADLEWSAKIYSNLYEI